VQRDRGSKRRLSPTVALVAAVQVSDAQKFPVGLRAMSMHCQAQRRGKSLPPNDAFC